MLVYDLGGGTFDVTLLRLTAGRVQTLATDGDVQLGGHDWDKRLLDYAAECFVKTHQIDPRQDPATLNRLFLDAMEAKHTLTAEPGHDSVNYQGRFAEIAVTRDQFEEMSADLLERTSYTSRQLLGVAGLEWKTAAGAAGRRLNADADGRTHAAKALRPSARSLGQSRRSGGPRGRLVCRPPAEERAAVLPGGPAAGPQFQVTTSTPTAWASKASTPRRFARRTS